MNQIIVAGLIIFVLIVTATLILLIWRMNNLRAEDRRQIEATQRREREARSQLDAAQAELEQCSDRLTQYVEANSQLHDAETDLLREVERLQSDLDQLRQSGVVLRRHTVFLDGMPRAGKSTLIKRLTNPAATPDQLDLWESTLDPKLTFPVPLCWEEGEGGKKILHSLEFYDVGGENPGHIGDNIDEYLRRRPAEQEPAIALVIWDSEAELPEQGATLPPHGSGRLPGNMVYLNSGRLGAAYGTAKARQAISSFVFFLNKSDVVEERLRREGRADQIQAFFEQQRVLLMQEVYRKALAMYPREPSIAIGSARTGFGVHDCLGALVRHLNLERHFNGPSAPVPPSSQGKPPLTQIVERRGRTAPVARG